MAVRRGCLTAPGRQDDTTVGTLKMQVYNADQVSIRDMAKNLAIFGEVVECIGFAAFE